MEDFYQNSVTVHIALSSIPQNSDGQTSFINVLEKNLYTDYVTRSLDYFFDYKSSYDYYRNGKSENPIVLYHPLKYYLFGNFDIAFISLVDRYKFSQKLFFPKTEDDTNGVFSPSTFQTYTGITLLEDGKKDDALSSFFEDKINNLENQPFLGIANLKFNNEILIGNGNILINVFLSKVKKILNEIIKEDEKYSIIEAFSWFEITIVLFLNDPNRLAEILFRLRKLKLSDLENFEVLFNNSLFFRSTQYNLDISGQLLNSSILTDSHSYVGIRTNYIEDEKLFNVLKAKKIQFTTEIEVIESPGNLYKLLEHFQKNSNLSGALDIENVSLVTGKSDYIFKQREPLLANILDVFRALYLDKDIFKLARKVKTKILFDADSIIQKEYSNTICANNFLPVLKKFIVTDTTIKSLNKKLKALKISRQVRAKIIKIFYNYNNGIQDPVLYSLFLDFNVFITNLILIIEKEHSSFSISWETGKQSVSLNIQEFEKKLFRLIEIFQEGFNIRMLNCYQFEDINDFDLDFNSSIQQILTTYNSLAFCIGGNLFNESFYGPVILLNFKNTVANYYSINYNVYHLLSPEFVFFTITKEILNHFVYDGNTDTRKKILSVKDSFYHSIQSQEYFQDLLNSRSIDFDYLYIDAINFLTIFNLDFDLFQYWFWTYSFQNASMYDSIGLLKEIHFKKELFRLIFLAKLFKKDLSLLKCPLPELDNFWERYFQKMKSEIEVYFEVNYSFKNNSLYEFLALVLDHYGSIFRYLSVDEDKMKILNERIQNISGLETSVDKGFEDLCYEVDCYNTSNGYIDKRYRNMNIFLKITFNYSHFFVDKHQSDMQFGKPIVFLEKDYFDSILFIRCIMHRYLKLLFEKNNKKVRLLRRNWQTGDPLISFIQTDDDFLYLVDQTGGTFFTNAKKANEYFSIRNGMMQSLWHFAMIQKIKQFEYKEIR